MLWIYEEVWNVKHKMLVKSCKEYKIRNTLNGTKDYTVLRECRSVWSATEVIGVTVVVILGNSMLSRDFVVRCHFVEQVFLNLSFTY